MKTKSIPHLIAYYLNKVADYGSTHPSKPKPRSHRYRHKRLMIYKTLLHERIDADPIIRKY